MHFCLTGQYTPHALNAMMDNPTTSRAEVAKKLIEAAGGKMISFFSVPADGPGARWSSLMYPNRIRRLRFLVLL